MNHVAVLRQFNRSYTQRIGVLDDSYLDSGRSLGPSRVLFEIDADGTSVSDLRRILGLDSGYLSRLLRQLEADDVVVVRQDRADGRHRTVRLTAKGRRERSRLDQRAEVVASRLVEPLSERQRAELTASLATAERLLAVATVGFDVVDPMSADAQTALSHYFAELDERFGTGFDLGDGGTGADTVMLKGPDGAFVVVRSDRSVIGCGGVQRIDDTTGEVKRMWVHADWRGSGLGRRLLTHLETVASELGRSRVVLDTNETLEEAIAMYERSGYQSIDRYNDNPYAHRWFTKQL